MPMSVVTSITSSSSCIMPMAPVVGSVMLTNTLVVGEEDDGDVEGDDEDGAAVGPVGAAEGWQAPV